MSDQKDKNAKLMQLALDILSVDNMVVYVSPAQDPDVLIPDHLMTQERVVLHMGYTMPIPVDDLCVTEVGISATLRFKTREFLCFLPWECVVAVVSEKHAGLWDGTVEPMQTNDGPAKVIDMATWKREHGR